MAFTQLPGSNPYTYQGTPQADQGIFTTSNFIALGEAGDDLFNLGNVSQATVLGGQGNDLVTQNILTTASSSLQEGYVNGNLGNDTLGQLAYGMSGTISAFLGGQGNDTIFVGNLQSTQVNGNVGADTINVGINGGALNTANSSIFGGQGDDALNIDDGGTNRTYIATTFGGNLGNDSLTVSIRTVGSQLTNSTFEGGDGNDTIDGALSNVSFVAIGDGANDSGADFLIGGNGGGAVYASQTQGGGAGDTISGGALNDVLDGNNGQDVLSGGTGANRFVFAAADVFNAVTASSNGANATTVSTINSIVVTQGATDIISDWTAAAAGTNVIANALQNNFVSNSATSALASALTVTASIQVVRGTWTAATQTFSLNATGADALAVTMNGTQLSAAGGNSGASVITSTTVLLGAGTAGFSQANFV